MTMPLYLLYLKAMLSKPVNLPDGTEVYSAWCVVRPNSD